MIAKCKKCEIKPKITSNHTYRNPFYKIYCKCGNCFVSKTSLWACKVGWNKQNKKT